MQFEIYMESDKLYIIRERLDIIDPRFYTTFTNIYLLLGENKAMLIDTGAGISSIKDAISPIIGKRELIVINTHNHFDHIAGNHEFDEVYIHIMDGDSITKPVDVSFLQNSPGEMAREFIKSDFKIPEAKKVVFLEGDEIFELGGLEVSVIHTPGHTPGSICIIADNMVFTGDTAHYGALYLPSRDKMEVYVHSLKKLHQKIVELEEPKVYPGHEEYGISGEMISDVISVVENIEFNHNTYEDSFLNAQITKQGKFILISPLIG